MNTIFTIDIENAPFIKNGDISSSVDFEKCYVFSFTDGSNLNNISIEKLQIILDLILERNEHNIKFSLQSYLIDDINKPSENTLIVGPRKNFPTSWRENAMNVFQKCNITEILNVEYLTIYKRNNLTIQESELYDKMTHTIYNSIVEYVEEISLTGEKGSLNSDNFYYIDNIKTENDTMKLNMSEAEINYYNSIPGKTFTNIELFDLAQCNSEHARHWVFNGKFNINGTIDPVSLLQKIKSTNNLPPIKNKSVIAFSDNASAIEGYKVTTLIPQPSLNNSNYILQNSNYDLTSNAETHNFPTGICPFPGAATGTGGRIRDTISIGRGGKFSSGFIGYCVGNLNLTHTERELTSLNKTNVVYPYMPPNRLLIEASNGASDYGNKIGEPLIAGFTRSFGETNLSGKHYEYIKPILYSAGNGVIHKEHKKKHTPKEGDLIVRIGGPAYKIGLGGGSASSRNQDKANEELDFNAVQRGDPEMENRVCRFIETCMRLENFNPILSIHDQGSGGMANVTKEIIYPRGADIYLKDVNIGDPSMSSFDIWNAEYQEQCTILINESDLKQCRIIAKRENVPLNVVGEINNSNKIKVYSRKGDLIVDLDLDYTLNKMPSKIFNVMVNKETPSLSRYELQLEENASKETFNQYIKDIFSLVGVGSKQFLTSKVDRSVTGLIGQQQCIGPWNLPLSDYSITCLSHFSNCGIASSIGEAPIKGFYDVSAMVSMSIGEMLTNLIFVVVEDWHSIKCQVNWMWSAKLAPYDYLLYKAVNHVTDLFKLLEIGIDGGKDSLSMNTKLDDNTTVISPNTCVVKSYAPVPNVYCKVTPEFKSAGNTILLVNLAMNKHRLGGSALLQTKGYATKYSDTPRFEKDIIVKFKEIFQCIQNAIKDNVIVAGHDISDGGLITTLIEMSISSQFGMNININYKCNVIDYFFSEELGLVLELNKDTCIKRVTKFIQTLNELVPISGIGDVTGDDNIRINYNNTVYVSDTRHSFLKKWQKTSSLCDLFQTDSNCVMEEYSNYVKKDIPKYNISFSMDKLYNKNNRLFAETSFSLWSMQSIRNVAIIRDEGSNGDREMASAFYQAGFNVIDVCTTELLETNGKILESCLGLALVGGFTYSDVFGSANAWFNIIKANKVLYGRFNTFFQKETSFSLGICNGCQLLSLFENVLPPCKILKNKSNRFESRYVNIVVKGSDNTDTRNRINPIFTQDMEGTMYGMHSAHGEGRIVLDNDEDRKYCYMYYADNNGNPTETYPYNPNGSQYGIAGLVSKNGRHMGLMPHPERCFLNWQLHWKPYSNNASYVGNNASYSPWFKIFNNCYMNC